MTPPPTGPRLLLAYVAFAVIASLANLGAQRLVLAGGTDGVRLLAALVVGTGVGLVVKYALDKRWIFHDRIGQMREEGRKFTLYTLMGLATTAIFWGMEALFWLVWATDAMREVGAALGLAIGYAVKYRLDRRYVFAESAPA